MLNEKTKLTDSEKPRVSHCLRPRVLETACRVGKSMSRKRLKKGVTCNVNKKQIIFIFLPISTISFYLISWVFKCDLN